MPLPPSLLTLRKVVLCIAALLGLLIFGWHLHRRRQAARARVTEDVEGAEVQEDEVKGSPVDEGVEGNGYQVGYAATGPVVGEIDQGGNENAGVKDVAEKDVVDEKTAK